ncbi:aldose epimerase family protein [Candidatus Poriferisocius sp.]|uniref:aldose epimerase family protein n=1 Tax=Candidatus Poriferisocius sp. TaxID=3101276 RepID=UPI003B59AC91
MSVSVSRVSSGREAELWAIEMASDSLTATLLNVGASLWKLTVRTGGGERSVCLHHRDVTSYWSNRPYFGCTVGPVANRIRDSHFELDGTVHVLEPNEGPHHLHGGPRGLGTRAWDFDVDRQAAAVTFATRHEAGDGGYPGNLDVAVTWRLGGNTLAFEWIAVADEATPISLTTHPYWNLGTTDSVDGHALRIDASHVVEVDEGKIPTGRLLPVSALGLDFLGGAMLGDTAQVRREVDHCFALDQGGTVELASPSRDLVMTMETDLPGLQVYTGDLLDGSAASGGYGPRAGVCLEPQYFPNAVNEPSFECPILSPGVPLKSRTVFSFTPTDQG